MHSCADKLRILCKFYTVNYTGLIVAMQSIISTCRYVESTHFLGEAGKSGTAVKENDVQQSPPPLDKEASKCECQ